MHYYIIISFTLFFLFISIIFGYLTYFLCKDREPLEVIFNKILIITLFSTCSLYILIYKPIIYITIGIVLSLFIAIGYNFWEKEINNNKEKEIDRTFLFFLLLFYILFWPQILTYSIVNIKNLSDLEK